MEPPFDKLEGCCVSRCRVIPVDMLRTQVTNKCLQITLVTLEAVKITYDPSKIDYATLLNVFWHNVDPLTDDGQFCDKGVPAIALLFFIAITKSNESLTEESKSAP